MSRWRPLVPALLLTAIACLQIGLAQTVHLSAWKGGGFGMFSTLDDGPRREVRILVEAPERSEELAVPPSLEDIAARAATLPSTRWLDAVARGVVDRERRHERPVTRVRIQVWRRSVDPLTLRASSQLLQSHVYVAATDMARAGQ